MCNFLFLVTSILSGRKKTDVVKGLLINIREFIDSLNHLRSTVQANDIGELVFWPDQISCPSSRWLKYSVQFRGLDRKSETVLSHSN